MDGERGTEVATGETAPDVDVAVLVEELVRLVRAHGGSETVLFTAAEVERREFAAYAHGWNDAIASLPPQFRRPELTLVEGGAVIPFPRGRREDADSAAVGREPDPPETPRGGPESTRPRFVAKSARSKSPTIPKLERGSSRRPDRRDFFDH
ncbi:hypothetical protein [Streptomyces ipomoeae]|uniref:Uncharacterized protein n=1 Tax=Streptomyces ipomoeae 91-03 TaxID=698759 RepID=L1L2W2_9ACTN|nr:hypothetical protein [Streptomyces ipomoeae]EKX67139.1 hypothetical protein STRIP9103_03541 [Streptomyces ipomoeae 91-03]TQE25589.1 hypothetical protein Sipo7851_34600 [Streptomyces ipomoeae]